ncbi:MAG: hypothetical protein AAGE52_32875 [Myxococcota bacterium]
MLIRRTVVRFALASLLVACPGGNGASWEEAFDASSVGWLLSVWGPSSDNLYAVGGTPTEGVVWNRNADGWQEVPLGVSVPLLNWVYGFGADNIFFAGNEGTIVHWDGASFSVQNTPTSENLWGVWGAAPDDVYAVGGSGRSGSVATVIHFDGSGWTAVETPELSRANVFAFFKVWGSSANDVWVVGQRGALLHFDGSEWREELIGTSEDLISVWGTGPNRVAVVGGRSNGWVFRYDGESWESAQPSALPGFNGVWMGDPDVIHVAGAEGQLATIDFASLELLTDDFQDTRLDFHAVFGDGDRLTAVGGNFNMPMGPFSGIAYHRTQ